MNMIPSNFINALKSEIKNGINKIVLLFGFNFNRINNF